MGQVFVSYGVWGDWFRPSRAVIVVKYLWANEELKDGRYDLKLGRP